MSRRGAGDEPAGEGALSPGDGGANEVTGVGGGVEGAGVTWEGTVGHGMVVEGVRGGEGDGLGGGHCRAIVVRLSNM